MQAFVFCGRRNNRRNKLVISEFPQSGDTSVLESALSVLGQGWLGTLLGIGGIVFAFFTYVWTRRRTRLAYVFFGEHLLGSATDALPAAIDVQYDGVSIPRLSKSQIIIWNDGENIIPGTDIVTKDPLRLQVGDDGKILSVSVIKTSRDVIDVKLVDQDHPSKVLLTFDYLDANDGFVIEILHTSTDRKPSVKGTLRGLPQGISNYGQFTRPKPQKETKGKIFKALNVIFSPPVFVIIGFLFAVFGPHPAFLTRPDSTGALSTVAGAASGLLTLWVGRRWEGRRKYPKSLHLEALE
ncbi:hypothetical protein [Pseudomonas graminis]|uniref:hypothetical protein n=1 Tax=Pseudomonas graminis TaxID=158627 RepID=UPI003C197894